MPKVLNNVIQRAVPDTRTRGTVRTTPSRLRAFVVNLLRALIQTARRVSHFEDWYNTRQGIGRHGANHATRHRELTTASPPIPPWMKRAGWEQGFSLFLEAWAAKRTKVRAGVAQPPTFAPPSSPRARP